MSDHVVDTNVLLIASAAHPYSPFDDSDVSADQRKLVLDWLRAFGQDSERLLVLDSLFRIYQEYRNKLSGQDLGLMVIDEKLRSMRAVEVAYDQHGVAQVPATLSAMDPSDRKFAAAAIADGGNSSIVNAADSDWAAITQQLAALGVAVEQLLDD